jgi:hypothetical protein
MFFASAGLVGKRPRTVPCGGRRQAYDAFVAAISSPRYGELALLLVDSEAPISVGHTIWQHLSIRDGWSKPTGAGDEHVFLMVQVMEAWFIADKRALQLQFGAKFDTTAFPAWPSIEAVTKDKVFAALAKATAACGAGYAKGSPSFEILGRLNAHTVEAACPHAKRLLNRLRSL